MQLETTQINTVSDTVENIYIEDLGATQDMTSDDLTDIMALDQAQRKRVIDALRVDADNLDIDSDKHCDYELCDRKQTITGHILLQSELVELCLFCQGVVNTDTYGYSKKLNPELFDQSIIDAITGNVDVTRQEEAGA